MAQFRVTAEDLENFEQGGGNDKPQAAGPWQGRIAEVDVKDIPSSAEGEPFAGYETTDGEVLTVYLRDQEPLDPDMDSVGDKVFFLDFVLRDGMNTIYNCNPKDRDAKCWQLQRSVMRGLSLAQALGHTVTDGNGSLDFAEGFFDALQRGDFENTVVQYTIGHPKPSKKTGKVYPYATAFKLGE